MRNDKLKTFTLQWHITQKCELSCRHCYDRRELEELSLVNAEKVLDNLEDFCKVKEIPKPFIYFTGGNPFLYTHFLKLYEKTVERKISLAVMGNPISRELLNKYLAIKKPSIFQVSLEGFEDHNDYIRGKGHFKRIIAFLKLMQELEVNSSVMLTVTNDNIDQVIPLAKFLKPYTNAFIFNRVSLAGEARELVMAPVDKYELLLRNYLELAVEDKGTFYRVKDNFFNIIRYENNQPFLGGCTGFGCGAAYNFVALLSNGAVHACRKYNTFIGNIYRKSLLELYNSESSMRYRRRSEACLGCEIIEACGGCLASTNSFGLDEFKERDPYCFKNLNH